MATWSRRSAPASASARSRCCAISHGRRPCGAADAQLRVSRLRRSTYLTAVTGYPVAAAAGEDLVASRLEADAGRLHPSGR